MTLKRPNILCIVSEDCPTRLGLYGDRLASTPNLDRLASQGVTWNTANCTAPVCAPSRYAILTGRHAESAPPAQHMAAFGPTPPDIATYPQMMRAAGYYCTNNSKTHYNCDIDPNAIWDETSTSAHWRNVPAGKPFLAVFNTLLTHESCILSAQPGAVEPGDVEVPPYLPDTDGTRSTLAGYYNRIAEMDGFMGERLRELDEAGAVEDTIVLYFSDHASPLPRSKRFVYDDGLRVPLVVRVPNKWRHLLPLEPGSHIDAPVSLVDLMASFAAVAGCAVPERQHGVPFLGPARVERTYAFAARDRMDERYDMSRTVTSSRYRYIRNYSPHRTWGQHYAFAWEGQAYQDYETEHLAGRLNPAQERFWQQKPSEELYDRQVDPHAICNLADDPSCAVVLREMSAALDEHMLDVHDCGFIPEGSSAESWERSRDPLVYPLQQVIALAARAIRRDPLERDYFVATLSDPIMVMRYWAAQALLMLAVAGEAVPDEVFAAFSRETDPHVKVVLSEVLGQAGDAERQVRFLTDFIEAERKGPLRLQAICALTELPRFPAISLALMTKLAEDTDEYVRGAAGYLMKVLDGSYRPTSKIFRFDLFTPLGHTGLPPQSPPPAVPGKN